MSELNQGPVGERFDGLPGTNRREQAVFLGWQKTRTGRVYPLYNVTLVGHPYFGSTVSDKTLRRLNLDVPNTPPPFSSVEKP